MTEAKRSVERALADQCPLLYHLNADTSWLLQIPRSRDEHGSSGRYWFNILIDPWLSGAQSDVASWFSTQTHAILPFYGSIKAVENLARENEEIAAAFFSAEVGAGEELIDAVAISHEYTDHCHKQTLLEIEPSVPVFATTQAAKIIRGWSHFAFVAEPQHFGIEGSLDWTRLSREPLPNWISITRVITEGDAQYYHSALMITFKQKNNEDSGAQAIIYTPHGMKAEDLGIVAKAEPRIHTLALLHGLHKVSLLKKRLNLGAHNGLQTQRLLNARYWIGTHDEVKKGTGIVARFLGRKVLTVADAMRAEQSRVRNDKGDMASLNNVQFTDLANGQFAILA